ncbi:MAG: DUF438 domain-containing protein [Firmicutes bacterium]|nr:DUF438 domain-containing protein [Bacillota bacterium]
MSEKINNREHRKEVIKGIIKQLHDGKGVDDVKQQFAETFEGVSATEITEAEQALISEGMPITEVQRLCDVHASVFKGSIEEIHEPQGDFDAPGHPVNVLKRENRYIEQLIKSQIKPYIDDLSNDSSFHSLKQGFEELAKIDIHYSKKENLMFPFMEKYGITAPPQVMWGVDDEIRGQIKEIIYLMSAKTEQPEVLKQKAESTIEKVAEMIFKEEKIMLPMLTKALTQDEWKGIADEGEEIGFLVEHVPEWNPKGAKISEKEKAQPGVINMPSGSFKTEELVHLLNALPFDITFVDKDDVVKYFSQGKERIFARTKTVIGRNVSNCHPPASVHVVEDIVKDFKSGKKDSEEFWINMGGIYVYIRYFAVRNDNGEYLGVLEVTQNIKPIQEITGEKRLVD